MKKRVLLLALCASALTPISHVYAQPENDAVESDEADMLFPVRVDGKWGVVDASGNVVIPAQYNWARIWRYGEIAVQGDDYNMALFNREGETLIPAKYRYIFDFQGREYTKARVGKDLVVINRAGETVLGPGFQTIELFERDKSWVVGDGRNVGVLTLNCEWLLEPKYERVSTLLKTGVARVEQRRGKVGLVNSTGKWVARPGKKFEDVFALSKAGLMPAKEGGKWGLIDSSLNWVMEPLDSQWGGPSIYSEPTQAVVQIDKKRGVVDLQGKFIIPAIHTNVFGGVGMAFTAVKDGKYGAYDRAGNLIVPFEYDSLWAFDSDGTTRAKKDGRSFWIDLTGKEVEKNANLPKIERVQSFGSKGWAAAKRDGKWGAVNKAHEWVLEPEYECVERCQDELAPPPPAPSLGPQYEPLPKGSVKKPREQAWCRANS